MLIDFIILKTGSALAKIFGNEVNLLENIITMNPEMEELCYISFCSICSLCPKN